MAPEFDSRICEALNWRNLDFTCASDLQFVDRMARARLIVDPTIPYHLCARTNNRDWFAAPMDVVWRIMSDYLFFISHAFEVEIFSFVLMDNHFHLIARFPSGNMAEAMQYFMRETSRSVAFCAGRTNHVYGSRYYRCAMKSHHHFRHAYKYIYRNPVEAGLCNQVEDYRYSSLRGLLGFSKIHIPLVEDVILFDRCVRRTLAWLNHAPEADNREVMRLALRREVFRLPVCRSSRREHSLETMSY